VKSETISKLIGLLSHENADIVIDVVEVIHEFTDEEEEGGEDDDNEEAREEAMKLLVNTLVCLAKHSPL
jgi:beta-catenin-like protein 1